MFSVILWRVSCIYIECFEIRIANFSVCISLLRIQKLKLSKLIYILFWSNDYWEDNVVLIKVLQTVYNCISKTSNIFLEESLQVLSSV